MKDLPETALDLAPAGKILEKFEKLHPGGGLPADYLIPLLQEMQEAYGYLPSSVLSWVSARTGIPTSRMYGVITFYAQFYTEPHGKHLVRCCRGTACHVRGGKKVITAVRNTLGVEDGATTDDMLFSFETVACLGACALSPIMVVDNAYYGNMSARRAEQILRSIEGKESR
jgi:NADH:ubiquinone oxidoreductase subunit E